MVNFVGWFKASIGRLHIAVFFEGNVFSLKLKLLLLFLQQIFDRVTVTEIVDPKIAKLSHNKVNWFLQLQNIIFCQTININIATCWYCYKMLNFTWKEFGFLLLHCIAQQGENFAPKIPQQL